MGYLIQQRNNWGGGGNSEISPRTVTPNFVANTTKRFSCFVYNARMTIFVILKDTYKEIITACSWVFQGKQAYNDLAKPRLTPSETRSHLLRQTEDNSNHGHWSKSLA